MACLRRHRGRDHVSLRSLPGRLHHLRVLRRADPHDRRPLALAPGGYQHLLRLWHLHRRGGGDAPERPSLSLGDHRDDERHAPARRRDLQPPRCTRGRRVHDVFRQHQFRAGLRQLPHAVDDADRLALRRDPDLRRAHRAVHHRADRQRLAQRLPGAGRRAPRDAFRVSAGDGQWMDPADDGRPVPRAGISRRARRLQPDGGRHRRHLADADQSALDHGPTLQWGRFRGAARRAVLPARRRAHDFRECRRPHDRLLAGAHRASSRRSCPGGDAVQHVLLRHFGIVLGGRRGSQPHASAVDGGRRLRPRLHRGADRVRLDDGEPDPAQHHGGGLRCHRQRLYRRIVSRRRRTGCPRRRRADDLQLFLRPGRTHETSLFAACDRRCREGSGAAPGHPRHHHGGYPHRLVHAHRGGDDRGRLYPAGAHPVPQLASYPPAAPRLRPRRPALLHPAITVAAASAFGWMLAYLHGPDAVSDWISSAAGTDPLTIMFLLVAAFVIIGDFVDAIPAIIIFMPIINRLTELGGINPVHMGVVIIVTLAFGLITPPYGLALLMAAKFINVRFSVALVRSLPLYVVFFATIAFSIFFPDVVLWLPKHVLPESVGCFKSPTGAGYICPG